MDWQESDSNPGSRRSGVHAKLSKGMDKIFPVILALESPFNDTPIQGILSWMGLFVEAMQQMAFCVNPRFGYTATVPKELAFFLYSSHIPLWDSLYVDLPYSSFLIWYWCVVGLTLIVVAYISCGIMEYFEQMQHAVATKVLVPFVHVVVTVFAVPFLHGLAANMFCYERSLWAFPSEQCWELQSTLYFCFSIAVMCCVVGIMLVGAAGLFTDDYAAKSILARAHGRMDIFVVFQKAALVLFYHLLLGPGWRASYCFFVILLNTACFAGYTFVLPYYSIRTNQIKSAIHLSVAAAGAISFCAEFEEDAYTRHNTNTLAVFCLIPFAAMLGFFIGGMRPLAECLERMDHLKQFGEVYQHKCYFPTGLVDQDQYFSRMNSLETDILESGRAEGFEDEKYSSIEILIPYLESVLLTTDVEVATRFLVLYSSATSSPAGSESCVTSHMTAFAARIFIKGIVRYKKKTIVHFHFANFVKTFCPPSKLVFSLEQCDAVLKDDLDISMKFQAYRVLLSLRLHLGIHDRSHMFSLTKAKRCHKDALSDMSTFWLKLMDSKHDLLSLACLTNQITEKRDKGLREYQRAIQEGSTDREVLSSYASFLESVMLDKKQSEHIQTHISELGEELVKSMMSSKTNGKATKKHGMSDLIPSESEESDSMGTSGNNSAVFMSKSAMVALTLVGLMILLIFVLGTVASIFQKKHLEELSVVGMARTTIQMASREIGLILSVPSTQLFSHQVILRTELDLFLKSHNKLTYGDARSAYGPIFDLLQKPRYLLTDCEDTCHRIAGLWSFGLEMVSTFTSVGFANANGTTDPSSVIVTKRDASFVATNSIQAAAWGYSDLAGFLKEQEDVYERWFTVGMSFALFLSFYVIVIVNVVFNFNFQKIGANKMVAIHLFSLIPFTTQKQLHLASRERIKEFDRQAREADKGTEQLDTEALGQEDDEDEQDVQLNKGASMVGPNGKRPSMSRSKSVQEGDSGIKLTSIIVKHKKRSGKKKKKKTVTFNLVQTQNENEPKDCKPAKLVEEALSIPDIDQVGLTVEERMELLTEDNAQEEAHERIPDAEPEKKAPAGRWLPIIIAILFFGIFGTMYSVHPASEDLIDESKLFYDISRHLFGSFEHRIGLSQAAISSAATGSHDYWLAYWNSLASRAPIDNKDNLARDLRDNELTLFGDVCLLWDNIVETDKIALAIAGSGWGLDPDLMQHLTALTWGANDALGYQGKTTDLTGTADEKIERAYGILVTKKYFETAKAAADKQRQLLKLAKKRTESQVDDSKNKISIAIGLCCAMYIIILLLAGYTMQNNSGAIKIMLLLCIVLLVPHILVLNVQSDLNSIQYDEAAETLRVLTDVEQSLTDMHSQVQAYVLSKDRVHYETFWKLSDESTIDRELTWILGAAPDGGQILHDSIRRDIGNLQKIYFIMFEMMSYEMSSSNLPFRTEHMGYQWNITAEGRSVIPKVSYSNRTHDMLLTPDEKSVVMKATLFSEGGTLLTATRSHVNTLFQSLVANQVDDAIDNKDGIEKKKLAVLILLCVSMLNMCMMSVVMGIVATDIRVQNVSAVVEKINKVLFQGTTMKCRIAFLLVLSGVTVQYVLALNLISVSGGKTMEDINLATSREWTVARSAIAADRLYQAYINGDVSSNEISDPYRLRVQELIQELSDIKNKLFLGSTTVDRMYGKWLINLQEISTLGADASATASRTPQAIHEELIATMRPLIEELWKSGDTLVSDVKKDVNNAWLYLLLCSCVILIATFLLVKGVLSPVVIQLVNEEHGTKVLLKMIPSKVFFFSFPRKKKKR